MRMLLDTHIWLWLRTEPARLPSPVRRKLRADNPVRGVKRYPDRQMQRHLTPLELTRLGKAIEQSRASYTAHSLQREAT